MDRKFYIRIRVYIYIDVAPGSCEGSRRVYMATRSEANWLRGRQKEEDMDELDVADGKKKVVVVAALLY